MGEEEQQGDAAAHAYRAKLMDEAGRIETTISIMAGGDREALEQVSGLARSYNVELWDGGRLVLRMPYGHPG